jgi:hypothetical protein
MNNYRGQSLITKYVWVIETIHRRRKISFKELNERWLRDDISRGVGIPRRTFDNWRYVIWDMFGINIVNEHRGKAAPDFMLLILVSKTKHYTIAP